MEKAKKIRALEKCRDEYIERKGECSLITINWERGDKSGIISRVLMDAILDLCAKYAQDQIDKLEGKEPEKFSVAVIKDDAATQIYNEDGIEALNEYCVEMYVEPIRREFNTESEMQAYLKGLADIGAFDERSPASYAVIMDEDLKKLEI